MKTATDTTMLRLLAGTMLGLALLACPAPCNVALADGDDDDETIIEDGVDVGVETTFLDCITVPDSDTEPEVDEALRPYARGVMLGGISPADDDDESERSDGSDIQVSGSNFV